MRRDLRLRPAVSTSLKRCSCQVTMVSVESLVVPGTESTMLRSKPHILFTRELLPTLGLPTTASDTASSSECSADGSTETSASRSSPVPVPCRALTG